LFNDTPVRSQIIYGAARKLKTCLHPHPPVIKFAINGSTIATSVTVMAETNWPDYVFGQQYQLRPLAELSDFIKTNHHLPDVPFADEIKKDAQNLGEMKAVLLKKVEELTIT
jgi:hypothetical protein